MQAFVLTGGGSLGAVHAGMLQAIYERGIAPDVIIGTSVGAINGGYIASRPPTVATSVALGDVWRGLERSQVFPIEMKSVTRGLTGRSSYLVPNDRLRHILDSQIEVDDLADMEIPLRVVATDLVSGEELLLDKGDPVEAILASSALPGIFPPIAWGDRYLVDGGVTNFSPISHALALGAETIYVLASGTACGLNKPPRGAIAVYMHSTSLVVTARFVFELGLFQDRARIVVVPPPCPVHVTPNDFTQADDLIRVSYESAATFLDGIDPARPAPLPVHLIRTSGH